MLMKYHDIIDSIKVFVALNEKEKIKLKFV